MYLGHVQFPYNASFCLQCIKKMEVAHFCWQQVFSKSLNSVDCTQPAWKHFADVFPVVASHAVAIICDITLESISREQSFYRTLFRLIGWRAEYQSNIKKLSVETYDKKQQVFDLFLKGANNMIFFAYSQKVHALKWGKRRRKMLFFSLWHDVWNQSLMLLWCLQKGRQDTRKKFVITHTFLFLEMNNTERHGRFDIFELNQSTDCSSLFYSVDKTSPVSE